MADARSVEGVLRAMTAADLKNVWELRNHPEIRRYMFTQHEISIEEHTSWFDGALQNPALDLLVLELDGQCCGVVQFKETNFRGVVDWGFYVALDAPKGTGKKLGLGALNHAFKKKNLHKICGQALLWNKPSISFHKSLGFTQEGVLRNQYFDGTAYHDLICFGILKSEWVTNESLTGTNQ